MITAQEAREMTKLGQELNSISEGIENSARHGKQEYRVNAPVKEVHLNYIRALGYKIVKYNSYYTISW